MVNKKENRLPRWRLDAIYPDLESREYETDIERFEAASSRFERWVENELTGAGGIRQYIDRYNELADRFLRLYAFAYAFYSADTTNELALRRINRLEALKLALSRAEVRFRHILPSMADEAAERGELEDYRFFLKEQLFLSSRQMSEAEEDLAEDLSRSGADAWQRLQEVVSSTLKETWDPQTGESKTLSQLRALAYDASREVREKAFHLELAGLERVQLPLSAALNGVKGFTVTLNRRRGYNGTLERSLVQSRISPAALDVLIGSMEESLPAFRRYLQAKAASLGLSRLAFFDLFAPVGESPRKWSFDEGREFILAQFHTFSDALGEFARKAFDEGWIDAEPRDGKVGGAFCMGIPEVGQSRILCNFDGSFSAVTTLAHELGHAFHHHTLAASSHIHRDYPMTLAETASIFCENIVFDGAVRQSEGEEKLALLEVSLSDATQVIVDILSRFYFEKELLARRPEGEVPVSELNALMLDAQKRTYGDALEQSTFHPFMWAVKSHYYSAGLAYYNFPYAFGLLFGLCLLSIYREEGPGFREKYRRVLLRTGTADAMTVTGELGFDIEERDFWKQGLTAVGERAEEFIRLVG